MSQDNQEDLESLEKTVAVDWTSDGASPVAAVPEQRSAPVAPPPRAPAPPPRQPPPAAVEDDASDFEATVALPDSPGAELAAPGPQPLGAPPLRAGAPPLAPQAAGPPPLGGHQPAAPVAGPPPLQAAALAAGHDRQATARSLPRPGGAVAGPEGALDPDDIALDGPRSLLVLLLIALLATICAVGVGAILFYKLRGPAPSAMAAPAKPPPAPAESK